MTVPDATDDPSPPLAAEVEVDPIPDLLGEIERLLAVL